jgi:hypothetical protein
MPYFWRGAMAELKASRDPAKESYWRRQLKLLSESGMSLAKFCRVHGLNSNTMASWKYIIRDRDREARSRRIPKKDQVPMKFAKVEFAEPEPAAATAEMEQPYTAVSTIIAELVNAETGMKLRIFSGADQATLAALLSSWSGR